MRLKKIKLAGFKSFVDPTIVPFPSNLVCVVGPNGCGKSNIIDAVRWVMGESSAKQLRGESMADVIFNGSSGRKPVGQASIELTFDNRQGMMGGQYANYSEISVKRQINRDGKSNYILNGTRCRRRDITDIFLGTGLGPRSYSIIEQGMISRFIEAKPDDLRTFIEEAAGISKYKELRRETENRIKNTRENILRINDLVDELDKRIQVLKRQSHIAERYKSLKEKERLLKAQLIALKLINQQQQLTDTDTQVKTKALEMEAEITQLRNTETHIEKIRNEHVKASDAFNQIQGDFYGAGAEIARLEQAVQHVNEKLQQQQSDLVTAEHTFQEALTHQKNDQEQMMQFTQQLEAIQPQQVAARTAEQESSAKQAEIESMMQQWQQSWDEFNRNVADDVRRVEVERTHLQRLEQQITQSKLRKTRLEEVLLNLVPDSLEHDIGLLQQEKLLLDDEIVQHKERLQSHREQIVVQREYSQQFGLQLDEERIALQSAQGRISSLEALQQAALGKNKSNGEGTTRHWLEQKNLQNATRLAEGIEIESGWESALETVLGIHLEAVCVDEFEKLTPYLDALKTGVLGLFETNTTTQQKSETATLSTPLLGKIQANWPLDGLLTGVYAVDSLEDALTLRSELNAGESIITQSGIWLGVDWLRISKESDEKSGVLIREQELKALYQQISELKVLVEKYQYRLKQSNKALKKYEDERESAQATLQNIQMRQGQLDAQLSAKQARSAQMKVQQVQAIQELEELHEQLSNETEETSSVTTRLNQTLVLTEHHTEKRAELESQRDRLKQNLDQHRHQARAHKDVVHKVALQIQSLNTQQQSTQNSLDRMQSQLVRLELRCKELKNFLGNEESGLELKEQLENSLKKQLDIETRLQSARILKEKLEHEVRETEKQRQVVEQKSQKVRSDLEKLRMDWQALSVRCQTLVEQVGESHFDMEMLSDTMPEDAQESVWKTSIDQVTASINKLGVVNLAAIDECKEQTIRWQYLVDQQNDLNTALDTLESAIHKIDRETRVRFKETYDKVDHGLKSFFPRLFGGGEAYLELTGEDLLSTGVTIMARPPGKRNSTIHLLSGGEKALTAVALVFAIFEINPSPFCMLDEVDAPLDDANVGRFCKVVKEMSEQVQFIFISHNKITMEIAEHLMGVTMHEPGVSRLVAVDVNEALDMIEG
ncbi:MAG: chromosome segregation protein SMC [Gammaproteobacteria bacterium]|nr:chromosome segregation protein SMC [Gammaproteobacteria bacterium]